LNCKGVIREISNYIDGELDAVAKHELEHHLTECHDCTVVVDQTKKSIEILCDSQPIPLPVELSSRLHAALREKLGKKPS
jgi:anti-sigma factor RsiW